MNKTVRTILAIVGAVVTVAAVACVLAKNWQAICDGFAGVKDRFAKQDDAELEDFADEELFD